MFPASYFAPRYFPQHYFAKVGLDFFTKFWRGSEDIDQARGSSTITSSRGAFTLDAWRGKERV